MKIAETVDSLIADMLADAGTVSECQWRQAARVYAWCEPRAGQGVRRDLALKTEQRLSFRQLAEKGVPGLRHQGKVSEAWNLYAKAIDKGMVCTVKPGDEFADSPSVTYGEFLENPESEPWECDECGEEFTLKVWHCLDCDGHWSVNDRECKNCRDERALEGKPSSKMTKNPKSTPVSKRITDPKALMRRRELASHDNTALQASDVAKDLTEASATIRAAMGKLSGLDIDDDGKEIIELSMISVASVLKEFYGLLNGTDDTENATILQFPFGRDAV